MRMFYIVNPFDVAFIAGTDGKPLPFDCKFNAQVWLNIVIEDIIGDAAKFEIIELDESEATSEKLYSIAEELHEGL